MRFYQGVREREGRKEQTDNDLSASPPFFFGLSFLGKTFLVKPVPDDNRRVWQTAETVDDSVFQNIFLSLLYPAPSIVPQVEILSTASTRQQVDAIHPSSRQ